MAKKWKYICVSLLLFNIVRMAMIILTAYVSLYDIQLEGVESSIEFEDASGSGGSGSADYDSSLEGIIKIDNNTTTTTVESTGSLGPDSNISDEKENDPYGESAVGLQIDWKRSPDVTDPLFLIVVILEIITTLIITCFIMGPLTKNISLKTWLSSMAWFRLVWKRFLFVVMGIVYADVFFKYRKIRYDETFGNPTYEDSNLRQGMIWLTVVEYFTLGLSEISAKLFTLERIKARLFQMKKKVGTAWGNVAILVYLTGVLSTALRNLVVCLYFAFMAVFIVQNEQNDISSRVDVSLFTVVVVLQTVIVLIRGKYGNFFLYLFLGFFLHEGEAFTELLREDDKEKDKVEGVSELQTYTRADVDAPPRPKTSL